MAFVNEGAISNENFKSMETDNDPVLDIPVPKDTEKVQVEGTLRDSNSNSKTGVTQFCEYCLIIQVNVEQFSLIFPSMFNFNFDPNILSCHYYKVQIVPNNIINNYQKIQNFARDLLLVLG